MRRIVLLFAILLLAGGAYAANPVTVDNLGTGDFTDIDSAIASWCTGGTNAGEVAPFVINVINGPYTETLNIDAAVVGVGDIVGDLVIQAASPVIIQIAPAGVNGFTFHQDSASLTVNNFILCPDLGSAYIMSSLFTMNELTPANPTQNSVSFYDCVFTESLSGTGAPMVTDKATALANKDALPGARSAKMSGTAGKMIKKNGQNPGSQSLMAENCVFYGVPQIVAETNLKSAADQVIFSDCLVVLGGGPAFRCLGNMPGSYSFFGSDVTAGPLSCMAIINTPCDAAKISTVANSKNIRFETGAAAVNTADGVLIENELDLGAADNVNVGGFNVNGNQGNTSISNVIVDTYGPCIQTQPNAVYTIDNATLNSTNVSCIALTALDVGSLAVTDTIFSNALMAITGALPSGGMTVDYCAFVENGTDAIAARDDGINVPTYGVNLINADPLYVSKDATSADAFDVNAAAYSAAGTTGSDLAGGADYVGSDVAEWSLY